MTDKAMLAAIVRYASNETGGDLTKMLHLLVEEALDARDEEEARIRDNIEHMARLDAEHRANHGPTGRMRGTCYCNSCAAWRDNEATRDGAYRHREQWSQAEIDVLFDLDLSDKQKAAQLGRTLAAIRAAKSKARNDAPPATTCSVDGVRDESLWACSTSTASPGRSWRDRYGL